MSSIIRIKIKSREELEKLFRDDSDYSLDNDGDWRYKKNIDTYLGGRTRRFFCENMFTWCERELIASKYSGQGDYHYTSISDGLLPRYCWHKEWVVVIGDFHMKEIDI